MAIQKPDKLPEWASTEVFNGPLGGGGSPNFVEPTEGKKDIGWDYNEKPDREYMNWLQRYHYLWLQYIDNRNNEVDKYFLNQ